MIHVVQNPYKSLITCAYSDDDDDDDAAQFFILASSRCCKR